MGKVHWKRYFTAAGSQPSMLSGQTVTARLCFVRRSKRSSMPS